MALAKDYSFSSERLFYRGIAQQDAPAIVAWRSDPANYRNFLVQRPLTMERHLAWFGKYLEDPTRYDFMVLEKGRPIGTCSLSNITRDDCEASYMIGDTSCRGKGYATEALRAVCALAFRELDVERVYARILPDNAASVGVAKKAGMSEESADGAGVLTLSLTRPEGV